MNLSKSNPFLAVVILVVVDRSRVPLWGDEEEGARVEAHLRHDDKVREGST